MDGQPYLVQAVYSFKGKNNDELCFKKGDIITVTQLDDGGWWEGTLDEKTGWFPSNYVKEYKGQSDHLSPLKTPSDIAAQQRAYRPVVLKDFIDSEKAHITDLQHLMSNVLTTVEKSEILSKEEFSFIISNLKEVLKLHEEVLAGVERNTSKTPLEQRVGKFMLNLAPKLKIIHENYCVGHPKAAFIINKHEEELLKLLDGSVLTLTSGLSKPFRRVEKYPNHLQELERHLEESHPDRGDTQRAVSVYKDIASTCSVLRRQKEMEIEIMNGGVRGWEGQDIAKMGDIIQMGSVAVWPEHRDRYFVLFPTTLLMLSASHRMSAFIYEGKLPLTGIKVNKLEDTENYKNAFEIIGPLIERIVAICQTKEDQQKWVDLIREQSKNLGHKINTPLSRKYDFEDMNNEGHWSITRLRPAPPSRTVLLRSEKNLNPRDAKGLEEDAQILRVIEAYCTSANSRFTLNSDSLNFNDLTPHLSLTEPPLDAENKILHQTISKTVTELEDKVISLCNEVESLKLNLKEEKSAREELQAIVKVKLPSIELRITE
ncbi:rho guanine nucleotide exchange factor 7 isoform X1 [Halyomorpha halys]|uniref:rho guanine nucleotide exchange factor 7 isoform X1 n=1 Tax=Halyomorpha halys TaxID=286706 RepID=UPI0006D4E8D4|nr:rho guanine nucleotide exchange factor 7 isoform X1 [Halyomorpha halys]